MMVVRLQQHSIICSSPVNRVSTNLDEGDAIGYGGGSSTQSARVKSNTVEVIMKTCLPVCLQSQAMGSPPDTAHRLHQHTDAGDFCVKMRPISPLHSIFFTFHSFMSHFFCIFVHDIAHCSPSVPKCTTFLLTALIKNNN